MKTNPTIEPRRPGIEPLLASAPAIDLKALLTEASRSLATLDADRLEELAACCAALNRDLAATDPDVRAAVQRQAAGAAREFTVLGRVLDATRANLTVLERLRDPNDALEYSEPQARGWRTAEGGHGNH